MLFKNGTGNSQVGWKPYGMANTSLLTVSIEDGVI